MIFLKILIAVVALIIFNWFTIVPLIPKVDEEDIGKNINDLKKYQWFKNLLSDEEYRDLIIHDNDVRKTIGKFSNDKLNKRFFKTKYQRKLQYLLQKKSNQLVSNIPESGAIIT